MGTPFSPLNLLARVSGIAVRIVACILHARASAHHDRPPCQKKPPETSNNRPRGNLVESLEALGDREGARKLLQVRV